MTFHYKTGEHVFSGFISDYTTLCMLLLCLSTLGTHAFKLIIWAREEIQKKYLAHYSKIIIK